MPTKYGKGHTADAIFLLGLIALLMVADSLFAASKAAGQVQQGQPSEMLAVLSLPWMLKIVVGSMPLATLWVLNSPRISSMKLTFYFLLCYRPFGIQFHVETSLFNVYFAKLDRGTREAGAVGRHRRAARSGEILRREEVRGLHLEAHARFLLLRRLRTLLRQVPGECGRTAAVATLPHHQGAGLRLPALSRCSASPTNGTPLIGGIYSEDEIWSCTTCGACEEECPLLIEYIDKIVDLRRGMIDDGNVPQSLQKPLKALESRGNPYGKMEKKRADWAKDKEFQRSCNVKILDGDSRRTLLYFVDSITSYDDRIQSIGRATARILDAYRRRLRHPGRSRKGQRARSSALRRRDCSSWRCATTTPRPSRPPASSESSPPTRTPSTR